MPLLKKTSFHIFFFFFISLSYSQKINFKIDSLLHLAEQVDDSTKLILYKEISWSYRNNEPAKSILYGKKALELTQKLHDSIQMASVLNYLGVFERKINQYGFALEYYYKALKIAEAIKNDIEIGYCYNNIGEIYGLQSNHKEAFNFFNKALISFKKVPHYKGIYYAYTFMGQYYTRMKLFDTALEYYHKALEIIDKYEKTGTKATAFRSIGNIYFLQNQYQKAIEYSNKSLAISKNNNSLKRMGETYILLGSVYLKMSKLDSAKYYFNKARNISKTVNDLRLESNAYAQLSKVYSELKNYKKAYMYSEQYKFLSDSLSNAENTRIITQLNMQFNYDKETHDKEVAQQKKNLIMDAKLNRQKLIRNFILIVLAFVLVLTFLIFRNNRLIKKANTLLETQNQQIIEQNEEILAQRDEIENHLREVEKQRDQIIKQKKQITDSITYAEKIQSAILPANKFFIENFSDYFIFYRPRDIVSGDFYWTVKKNGIIFLTVADCTGHGVPGAIMSMLGTAFLNDILNQQFVNKANLILEELRIKIKYALKQTGKFDESKDGMDMALCVIDKAKNKMNFSGANRPVYIFKENEMTELPATDNPVGVSFREIPFENHEIEIKENDKIYLFTDGFADQFGGIRDKKYMTQRFINLIKSNYKKKMDEQRLVFENEYMNWVSHKKPDGSTYTQLDDILVIGVTI
ncbi:MAG: tetratricopeptide repeat protein [Chlorobi bacterium]|nr:tetratricopeptide repeat protein [Chlorobiota bacterium]